MSLRARYAIYLVPETASPLWTFGSSFLGYDAARARDVEQPMLDGISPDVVRAATTDPRRYGFHMTLKAPFRLAEGISVEALQLALLDLGRNVLPFDIGPLTLEARVREDGSGFVCLEPSGGCAALFALEQIIVPLLDRFRTPLTDREVARRKPEMLSTRQRELLERHGYPYVLDEFRPHFSLTGQVDNPASLLPPISALLDKRIDRNEPCEVRMQLFVQPEPDARFRFATIE